MRRIIDRYIFAELIPPFLLSLGGLCLVILTKEMLRLVGLLLPLGVGLGAVLEVFLYLLPAFLVLTLPIAGIIASITAFSRLSYDKELVAMQVAGLSLLRLSRPVFVFSCLVFGLTLALSQWGQPWSNLSLKRLALTVARDQLVLSLEKGVFNEPVSNLVVFVAEDQHQEGGAGGIFISDERKRAEPRLIVASSYRILHDPERQLVALRLFNGQIHSLTHDADRYRQGSFARYDLALPVNPNLYTPLPVRPSRRALLERLEQTNWRDTEALRRLTESYKDLAFPTAGLLFGMLGIPIGIVSKRSGRVGGFTIGVMIIIAYYMLNMLCDFLVITRVLSPFAGAWVPNAIVLFVGAVLFSRVARW